MNVFTACTSNLMPLIRPISLHILELSLWPKFYVIVPQVVCGDQRLCHSIMGKLGVGVKSLKMYITLDRANSLLGDKRGDL